MGSQIDECEERYSKSEEILRGSVNRLAFCNRVGYSIVTFVTTWRFLMNEVGIRELKTQASDIIRRVRDTNEAVVVTYRGKAVARIEPLEDPETTRYRAREVLAQMDRIAEEVTQYWPSGVSAVDAVAEDRRDL